MPDWTNAFFCIGYRDAMAETCCDYVSQINTDMEDKDFEQHMARNLLIYLNTPQDTKYSSCMENEHRKYQDGKLFGLKSICYWFGREKKTILDIAEKCLEIDPEHCHAKTIIKSMVKFLKKIVK
jgi:hypothetical protein